jgi:protein SCO1/2
VNRRSIALVVGLAAVVVGVASCGSDAPREMAGYRREPAPQVGELALPDLTDDGNPLNLQAEPGHVLAIYFGYTNCPDFCPTTLSDLKLATQRLDDPSLVDVAMITIDPDRDLPILADYVTSFFEDGHALGTDDEALLADVAAPFGAQYRIETAPDGDVEVGHSTALYAVDDNGELTLTWQFGVSIDDLAADLEALLDRDDR